MTTETEIKILEVDHDSLAGRLDELGATRTFEGWMEARFYDRGHDLRDAGIVLRLRMEADRAMLVCKGPVVGDGRYKMRGEIETPVDFRETHELLLMLGYDEIEAYRSLEHRISYAWNGTLVELDRFRAVSGVPPFVEIE